MAPEDDDCFYCFSQKDVVIAFGTLAISHFPSLPRLSYMVHCSRLQCEVVYMLAVRIHIYAVRLCAYRQCACVCVLMLTEFYPMHDIYRTTIGNQCPIRHWFHIGVSSNIMHRLEFCHKCENPWVRVPESARDEWGCLVNAPGGSARTTIEECTVLENLDVCVHRCTECPEVCVDVSDGRRHGGPCAES